MADADTARKVYNRMKENIVPDFTNIPWFPRPEGSAATSRHAGASTQCIGATLVATPIIA